MDLILYPWQRPHWERLAAAAAAGRMPHAILLAGPRGTGVEEFALCVAAHVLCERPVPDAVCCGTCRPCELFAAGSHPDCFRLEPDPESKSEQISVGQVRELIYFMHLSRQFTRSRVALAYPAENMNRAAANTLLKTLEEPPPFSVIILATHQPGNLPITVRSRCQHVLLHETHSAEALRWLESRAGVDAKSAPALLRHARGAPLLAESLARDDALSGRSEVLEDLLRLRRGTADPVAVAERWLKRESAEQLLGWLLPCLGEIARLKLADGRVAGDKSSLDGHLQGLADELDLAALVNFHDAAMASYRGAASTYNLNPRSLLEDLIAGWLDPGARRGGMSG
jgi:DNA polymerase-3 subunit delta'